jgi:hypothetical protein
VVLEVEEKKELSPPPKAVELPHSTIVASKADLGAEAPVQVKPTPKPAVREPDFRPAPEKKTEHAMPPQPPKEEDSPLPPKIEEPKEKKGKFRLFGGKKKTEEDRKKEESEKRSREEEQEREDETQRIEKEREKEEKKRKEDKDTGEQEDKVIILTDEDIEDLLK